MTDSKTYPKTSDEIADELLGTCQSLEEVLAYYGMEHAEDDKYFCDGIDARTFCCQMCGWWQEPCDMSETEWTCQDCVEGE